MYNLWFDQMQQRKLGKAQAREQFAPIVETLTREGGIVEVTDYGKVAAVIMSHKHYLWLLSRANEPLVPSRKLAGSAVLNGDLETASKNIGESVLESIRRSASEL